MDLKVLVGHKVVHRIFGIGTIVDVVEKRVTVDFNGVIKEFEIETMDRYFHFDDEATCVLIQDVLDRIKAAKAADEAAKKAAEEAAERARKEEAERLSREESERLNQEKRVKEEKRNRPIHPYIDERRNSGKHAVFLVCQNNNFAIESENGFIWAPTHIDKGEREVSSHAEMELVIKGDIIFHHFANHIYAISVARSDCELKDAVAGHPNAGQVGRFVDISYHILENPADTSCFKAEKAMYGSMKYGPFTKQGDNKQGFYLSELHDKLATIFIDAAIVANPSDATLLDLKKNI